MTERPRPPCSPQLVRNLSPGTAHYKTQKKEIEIETREKNIKY